jgi:hypothetical protein
MPATHFSPHSIDPRPCGIATWFDGADASGTMARCANSGCAKRRTNPYQGCSCFQREPIADDEPDRAPGVHTGECEVMGNKVGALGIDLDVRPLESSKS